MPDVKQLSSEENKKYIEVFVYVAVN